MLNIVNTQLGRRVTIFTGGGGGGVGVGVVTSKFYRRTRGRSSREK